MYSFFFFFNDTATTEIYTLSLHDALPILEQPLETRHEHRFSSRRGTAPYSFTGHEGAARASDRKSTRLNSSHQIISYAVFCLKKKKNRRQDKEQSRAFSRYRQSTLNKAAT